MVSNDGIANLTQTIKGQSKRIFELNEKNNLLGTVTSSGIYIDQVNEEIPKNDFLYLQNEAKYDRQDNLIEELRFKQGDRVICIPAGDYFIVLGKVNEDG